MKVIERILRHFQNGESLVSPACTIFLVSSFGPLALGLITSVIGLDFAPGVLAGVVLLFAIVLSVPQRLIDWLDEPLRQMNTEAEFDGWSFGVTEKEAVHSDTVSAGAR